MSAPIIITVPNNYLDGEAKVCLEAPLPPRKRKLDHLSWEEKMQRKKMKNRVAAQTSRDRKKLKMDEMDLRIQHLEDVNERLVGEMSSLKALNERLMGENAALRAAAARDVPGAPRPAEGGAPGGAPRGSPTHSDVPPLADILAHLDSEEYLDTLNQLAESLLQEIDASAAGAAQDIKEPGQAGQRAEGAQVVGPAAEHLEPSGSAVLDLKHDVDRIMSQHSYAHPHPDITTPVKEEKEDNDKGDMFYASFDEDNDCITVEVEDDQVVEEVKPISVKTEFSLAEYTDITLEADLQLLSPLSLSPAAADQLLASPAHTFSSDLGYESLASPLSEAESMDLSDFWCDSFSELFPGLA